MPKKLKLFASITFFVFFLFVCFSNFLFLIYEKHEEIHDRVSLFWKGINSSLSSCLVKDGLVDLIKSNSKIAIFVFIFNSSSQHFLFKLMVWKILWKIRCLAGSVLLFGSSFSSHLKNNIFFLWTHPQRFCHTSNNLRKRK